MKDPCGADIVASPKPPSSEPSHRNLLCLPYLPSNPNQGLPVIVTLRSERTMAEAKERGDHGDMQTPESCVADFCLIPVSLNLPIGTNTTLRFRKARHAHRFCVPRSRRSAAADAEEWLVIFHAFGGDNCW